MALRENGSWVPYPLPPHRPPLLKEPVDKSLLTEGTVGDCSNSAAQPGVTCSRPDPPPQLFLLGALSWNVPLLAGPSLKNTDLRVRMWLDLSFLTGPCEDKAFNTSRYCG